MTAWREDLAYPTGWDDGDDHMVVEVVEGPPRESMPDADLISVTPESIRLHDRIILGGRAYLVLDMRSTKSGVGKILTFQGRPVFVNRALGGLAAPAAHR
ncbi:hypothetical protein ACFVYT_39805 [Streptomyces sp. NPDC058290]|uniref:hypothetical protein n=1 Tax=Streptomyces sp. NPDC058290 TaxID=3346426 RepID=UPI0036EDA95B